MPVNTEDVLEVVRLLGEEENITIAVKHSLAGGLVAGGGAFAGGLILGPIGLALGGTVGGIIGSIIYKDSFISVGEALQKMPYGEKMRLADAVKKVLTNVDASDVVHLMAIISGDPLLRGMVVGAIRNQLGEMGLPILK